MVETLVEDIQSRVETGLQTYFGRHEEREDFAYLAGQLSVHPEHVGPVVTTDVLTDSCEDFSDEFKASEHTVGLDTEPVVSESGKREHLYLIAHKEPGLPDNDVIVDFTVGQFVLGHNHAFVGTRAQLRELVTQQTGRGKPYQLVNPRRPHVKPGKEKFFQTIWGNDSVNCN